MDLPFVSFCMSSYNQREYALMGLEAAMKQDYPNMEIIVSDDASIDDSASALREYACANAVKFRGGVRVLESKNNSGVLANYEKLFREARGELIIGADGDDISEPNRVSRIVQEWVRGGKKATIIFHDGWRIDGQGRVIGEVGRRSVSAPLGACMAYSPRCVRDFPTGTVKGCYQDHVLGRRGTLIGDTLFIADHLVRYRVGSGDSSILTHRRAPELRSAKARAAGYAQSLLDIEFARCKGMIDDETFSALRSSYGAALSREKLLTRLISGNIRERFSAFGNLYGKSLRNGLTRLPYLLPEFLGDILYGCYDNIKYAAAIRRYKSMKTTRG